MYSHNDPAPQIWATCYDLFRLLVGVGSKKLLHIFYFEKTCTPIPEAVADRFFNKSNISRSIGEAIVEQQILKKNNYNKSALKKTLVPPLPNMEVKEKPRKKMKPDIEKKNHHNLVA